MDKLSNTKVWGHGGHLFGRKGNKTPLVLQVKPKGSERGQLTCLVVVIQLIRCGLQHKTHFASTAGITNTLQLEGGAPQAAPKSTGSAKGVKENSRGPRHLCLQKLCCRHSYRRLALPQLPQIQRLCGAAQGMVAIVLWGCVSIITLVEVLWWRQALISQQVNRVYSNQTAQKECLQHCRAWAKKCVPGKGPGHSRPVRHH